MKKKVIAFMMAAAFLCNPWAHPVHDSVADQVAVSAAVTNTVPEGYTPIYTIDDLYAVRNNLSGKYILMNDIDLSATAPGGDWDSGNGWKPIGGLGESNFNGVFDGNGHVIKNMHIYGELDPNTKYVGLFGDCSYGCVIRLGLVDCDIDVMIPSKSDVNIGGILGYAYLFQDYHKFQELYVTGNIKVTDTVGGCYVGGLFGKTTNGVTVSMSGVSNDYSACNITVKCCTTNARYAYVGGISGEGGTNCAYSVGNITIIDDTENHLSDVKVGNINGSGGIIKNSFYLKTLNNYTASSSYIDSRYSNVNGLTAGQVKSSAAFVGFDFDNVWTIDPTAAYPYPTLKNVPYVSADSSAQPSTQPTTNPPSGSSLKGDINGDGVVNAKDATIILRYAAKVGTGQNVSIDDLY